ncbi:MAG: LPS export ABC transporter permease LptF [Desulfosalsimonadaceae bacterium]
MILNRYILNEIIVPMVIILTVLVSIFASYSTMHYLEDAVYGFMPVPTVISLILLKVIISLEVLLPCTLYLSVIVGIGRLYKDGEITAMFASGIGLARIVAIVLVLSFSIALIVASLSLFVRPWAYERGFLLKEKAKVEFDVTQLKAGRFHKIGKGNRFIFISKIDHKQKSAEGVFLQKDKKNERDVIEVICAKKARQSHGRSSNGQDILFLDGYVYELSRTRKGDWKVTKFDQLTIPLWPKEIKTKEYKVKAASTIHLSRSKAPSDIAELQWRYSTPLSTILLALLGIPLSRTTPRKGKYSKVAFAMLIYASYYGLSAMAKIFVVQEAMPALPGVWWVQVLLGGLLFVLLIHPSQQFWPRMGRH